MNRVAHEKVVLSDGTVIPKGAHLCVPNVRTYDPAVYENPTVFNGRRFYDLSQQTGEATKHQFVTTSDDYIPFGHGKTACPGRFFASNEIKIMLAHLLLQYDWKFPDDQGRPKETSHGPDCMANPKARILFKTRKPEVSLDLDNPNQAKSS
jgi:cytochrome P450